MKITEIHLSRLRNSEYIEYMRGYLEIFDRNDPTAMSVQAPFDALTAKIDDIEAVYQQDRASELTQVIADLDIKRDETLMSLSFIFRGYMGHYDESKVQDAKRLDTRLNVYGGAAGLARQTLTGETAALDNLIYDLQNDPALQASVMSLGLDTWIGQLKIINDNLRSAYSDRTQEIGAAPADKIKDLRNEGNDLYYALRDYLFANALLAGYAAPYDTVINETNALTGQFNQMLAVRSGGPEVDPEDDGGDNDVGEEN